MAAWVPMFALPNVDIEESIDADGLSLVSIRDERICILVKKHKRFAMYLRRFKSEFGRRIQPSIIIWRDDSA
jgi:hypothetical protein